ncbi:MAG: DUF1800 family protein [Myxococcota bacterium]
MARGARLSTTGHHTINRCLLVALLVTGLNACGDTSEPEAAAVSLQVDVRGWGDVEPRLGTFDVGQTVTLTATPRAGWVFAGWTGDHDGDEPSLSTVLKEDTALTAHFDEITHHDGWGETAVRKVLQTFAWGGFPTEAQLTAWAEMPPEEAIEEMLTFEPTNDLLSPPDFDLLGERVAAYIPEEGGPLEGVAWYFSEDPDQRLASAARAATFHPLAPLSPTYAWLMAVQARGLNTFYHRIGFWETNYHMVASQLKGVGSHTGIRHYDNIMTKLTAGAPYQEVLAQSALNAAIAFQYGHNYNRWQDDAFKGNEDFAREFHQLFFGILGDASRLGGAEGQAYHLNHERVSIKNTARALTGLNAYHHPISQGGPDLEIDFNDELVLHHVDDLTILDTTISGANAKEKIEALAEVAIAHPESLDNLPLLIISGLADDALTPEKTAALQALWKSLPEKHLLTFLRQYAISDLFHAEDRVNYLSSFERNLFIRNRMQLSNAELYLGEAGMSPIYWVLSEDEVVPFEPLHDVFGHQSGNDAYNDPSVFRHAYRRSTEEIWFYDYGTEPSEMQRDWGAVIPQFDKGAWLVKDVARFLWQRFVCDGLKHYGPLERAHIYALLAGKYGSQTGVDLGLLLDPKSPDRLYTEADLATPEHHATLLALGEEALPLSSAVGSFSANLRIQRAIAFIAATPFTHVQEGR